MCVTERDVHTNVCYRTTCWYPIIIVWFLCRLAIHEESSSRRKVDEPVHEGAVPAYLLDRDVTTRAKVTKPVYKLGLFLCNVLFVNYDLV